MNTAFAFSTAVPTPLRAVAMRPVLPLTGTKVLATRARAARMSLTAPSEAPAASPAKDSRQFSWTEQWFPVMYESDFDPSVPYAFTIWEQNLVMYRDEKGKYVVLDDVCTHRAAPLSEGRITTSKKGETVLECPYHGWAFNCSGDCVCIPQLREDQRIPTAANMKKVYETAVQDGMVFVWFGEEGKADIGSISKAGGGLDASKFKDVFKYHEFVRTLPYDAVTLIENVVDPEHVKWSHHGMQKFWDRKILSTNVDFYVESVDKEAGVIKCRYNNGDLSIPGANDLEVRIIGAFEVDYIAKIPKIGVINTRVFAVPVSREECKLFAASYAFFNKFVWPLKLFVNRPKWMQHWHMNMILDSDSALLRTQQRFLDREALVDNSPAWKRNYVLAAGKLDAAVLGFRKWLDEHFDSMPYRSPLIAPNAVDSMPRRELIERYNSHTKSCKVCTGAMKNMRRIRLGSVGTAVLCAVYVVASLAIIFMKMGMITATTSESASGGLLMSRTVPSSLKISMAAAGVIGMLGLVLAALLSNWLERFVYTDRSYKIAHAD